MSWIARVAAALLAAALFLSLPAGNGCSSGGGGGGGGSSGGSSTGSGGGGSGTGAGPRVIVSSGGAPGALVSPYPDDRFTVWDPTSPTGRRVVPPLLPATDLEADLAAELARLDGFGVLAPITVTFDDAIDLATIAPDTVLVVNAEPGSARFGEAAALDLGGGSYPTDTGRPVSYYPRDPLAASGDLVHAATNVSPAFEEASHTLVLRPLCPLEEGARHVVVLTEGLRGTRGDPVEPPAGFIRPTADDAALGAALAAAGRSLGEIRYQWSFMTGRPTLELRAISDGLDGYGPLASLAAAFPPRVSGFDDFGYGLFDGSPRTLDAGPLTEALGIVVDLARLVAPLHPDVEGVARLLELVDVSCAAYVATGAATGPDLRTSARGTFEVDLASGTAPARAGRTTFLLVVPRPCAENGWVQPPYPVVIFLHGNQRSRLDGLAIAAAATHHGWAVLASDAVDHGPDDMLARLPDLIAGAARTSVATEAAIRTLLFALGIATMAPVNPFDSVREQARHALHDGILRPFFRDGRAPDVDGDGVTDSGETFFTADVFRTRDIMRQTIVDMMSLARVAGAGLDVDGDGRLDAGGAGNRIAYTGISLGGIHGAIFAAVEPRLARAALMVPGGGLADIVVTSTLRSITRRVFREVFGPVLIGEPDGAGGAWVDVAREGRFGRVPSVPGGLVSVRNLRSGGAIDTPVESDGGFRAHLAADAGDPLEVESFAPGGVSLGAVAFAAPARGLGIERSTPRFREWLGFAAHGLEAADPACFAPFWRVPIGWRLSAEVLIQCSLGDTTVPVATGATLGRAAGAISPARNDLLIREGILDGGTAVNVDRVHGVESVFGTGIRFLGVNSHAGMLIPNAAALLDGARYATAAQDQAFRFIETGRIDDSDPVFDLVLPPF